MTSVISLARKGNPSRLLTSALQKEVEYKVLNGKFGTRGLEYLSEVLCELGADDKGYLGVFLCPYGTEKKVSGLFNQDQYILYKCTVAVWAIQDSTSSSGVQLLDTKKFSRWLRENIAGVSPRSTANLRIGDLALHLGEELSASDSISQVGGRIVPAPSSYSNSRVGNTYAPSRGGRVVPPPSQINTVTGDGSGYTDPLTRAEHEFIDTPKIKGAQGQTEFDTEEFTRRADKLDAVRKQRGLGPISGSVTPSTYRR